MKLNYDLRETNVVILEGIVTNLEKENCKFTLENKRYFGSCDDEYNIVKIPCSMSPMLVPYNLAENCRVRIRGALVRSIFDEGGKLTKLHIEVNDLVVLK